MIEESLTTRRLCSTLITLDQNLHLFSRLNSFVGIGGGGRALDSHFYLGGVSRLIALVECLVPDRLGDSVAGMGRPHLIGVSFTLAAIASTADEIPQDHFVASDAVLLVGEIALSCQ